MIDPEKTNAALEDWALGEIKNVGTRNFEMSKFLFGVSAGTFAIPAFFDEKITMQNPCLIGGIIMTAFSAFAALWIAEPAEFKINQDTNVSFEHEKYARKGQDLRHFWVVIWVIGVFLLFAGISSA